MSGKSRFKIPTRDEMEKQSIVNSMSRFQTFKQQKADSANSEQKTNKPTSQGSMVTQSLQKSAVSNGFGGKTSLASEKTASAISSISGSKSITLTASKNILASSTSNTTASGNKQVAATSLVTGEKSSAENLPGKSPDGSSTGPSKAPSGNSIIVNYRQRGNPILKHIRNVPWEYGSIVPDYVMGKANCALFLSLRYHQLNPTYIHNRLKELGKGYDLRVLLVQVDVTDPHHLLKDLAKMCILADCTLVVAFSVEEVGRYLETYKVYENKPAEALMEKTDTDYVSKLTDTLTTVKSVNKTDCMTLLSTFGSFEEIVKATKEDLSLCPGFGPQKAQRLYDVLHESFVKGRKRRKEETGSGEPVPSTSTEHSPVKKPR